VSPSKPEWRRGDGCREPRDRAAVWYDETTEEYVLVLNWPGGRRDEERFATATLLRQRLVDLKRQLARLRSNRSDPPTRHL
jgi:hypothetical protein